MLEAPLLIENLFPIPPEQVGLAVLGSPIKHSISPQLHKSALSELASRDPSFSNWVYHKVEVDPKNLAYALDRLRECGYRGLNLTIPHKVDVFSLLDTINVEARNIGAVNTLMYNDSEWQGFNSDGYGLEHALAGKLDVSLKSAHLLILGAGGAARAAAAQALSRGCERIWIGNRSSNRLDNLIETLGQSFDVSGVVPFDITQIPPVIYEHDKIVIINATSLGLNPSDPSPLSLEDFPSSTCVYDMIYNPVETRLLKEAKSRGLSFENGLSMLVHQAVRSLEIWTKQEISEEAMFAGARSAINL
jgi:shikimate dehydrogenase